MSAKEAGQQIVASPSDNQIEKTSTEPTNQLAQVDARSDARAVLAKQGERDMLMSEMARSIFDELKSNPLSDPSLRQTLEDMRRVDEEMRIPQLAFTLERLGVEKLSWRQLRALQWSQPETFDLIYQDLRKHARAHIESGHFGARAAGISQGSSPWERALYSELREHLTEAWQPRSGIEQTLLDQMTQAYYQYLQWAERLNASSLTYQPATVRKADAQKERITHAQQLEQEASMMDRWHRIFLRTQRALKDLRRYPMSIQTVSQMNVGDQQVNIAENHSSSLPELVIESKPMIKDGAKAMIKNGVAD